MKQQFSGELTSRITRRSIASWIGTACLASVAAAACGTSSSGTGDSTASQGSQSSSSSTGSQQHPMDASSASSRGNDASATSDGASSASDGAIRANDAAASDAEHDATGGGSDTGADTSTDAASDAQGTTDSAVSKADGGGDAGTDATTSDGSPPDAGGGGDCTPGCGAGTQCVEGKCVGCGAPGEACCGGTSCNTGISCIAGQCLCGGAGQSCCPASVRDSQSGCNASLTCAGTACTCLTGCSGSLIQRSDGSIWMEEPGSVIPVTSPVDDSFLIPTSYSANDSTLQCAVRTDGTVVCWSDSSYNTHGQLGNGTTSVPSGPTAVVTAVNGPALGNVAKVVVDATAGVVACAVDKSTRLWCWGDGASYGLGTGNTNDSTFATPVLSASGGSQFTGVDRVAVATDHVCAKKTDGTLWCWGDNSSGQIGTTFATPAHYAFPTQVTTVGANVVDVSVAEGETCALTKDGTVWCWGDNSKGLLGNGKSWGTSATPSQVQAQSGGPAFGGVTQVELTGDGTACALLAADRSLWCWGQGNTLANGDTQFYPAPYVENGTAVSGVYVLCQNEYTDEPTFIDGAGQFHRSGSLGYAPSCP